MPLSSSGKWRLAARNGDLGALSVDSLLNIFGQACNPLDPSVAVNLSSVVRVLREPTEARRQQLKTDHETAAALCLKLGLAQVHEADGKTLSCKELRETGFAVWHRKDLSVADLTTLATLGLVLPFLNDLHLTVPIATGIEEDEDEGEDEGVQRLAEGLSAGALPALAGFILIGMNVGDAGATALAAALDRGAMPRLKNFRLFDTGIGDAGLMALAPALRRRPALEQLSLMGNPLGDEGLAALLAPPPAGALPPPTGVLAELKMLDLNFTQITDAGCAALAAVLDSGALPALERLTLENGPASDAGQAAVHEALKRSRAAGKTAREALKKSRAAKSAAQEAAQEAKEKAAISKLYFT